MECIFCEFLNGRKNHKNYANHSEDYPLIPIHECKNFFVFLGIPDFLKESDLLIIPKKHIESIEKMESKEFSELTSLCLKIGKKIKERFGDYKLFLNNGLNAEQYINHVHFHLMPYTKKQKPLWHKLSRRQFEELSHELRVLLKHIH